MDVSLDCCQRPQTLPDDILILIARELKRAPHLDGLRNMSCISRRLRLLCLPILFEHSYMQYPSIMGTLDPPEAIRPYVQRLLCRQVYTKTPSDDFYKSYLGFFPNLKHVRFEGMPEGISPSIMDICLEKVTSLDVAYEARWKATTPINQTLRTPYSVVNQLSHFSLASHCFRELVSHLGRVDLEAEYALESRCLAKLVCDMHSTAELLSLPMETAPLRQMLELPWPRIRSFALHGRHLTLDQASALPAVLSHMPSLRTLRVQAAQPSSLSRNPILGISCTTLAVELRELRSLTVAYPNPDDPIFSLKTPHLTHLSLRDEPRYYFHLRNTELIPSSIAAPILKASECLTILRKKDVPLLTSLEVVYEADAEEDELLRHISSAYPNLAQLELHRYRASDCDCSDDRDPYLFLPNVLSAITSLKTLHLNLDCAEVPAVHSIDEEECYPWYRFLDERAREVLSIMQTCPRFEYVAFLDPAWQFCTWSEYRPTWNPENEGYVDVQGIHQADSDWVPYD